ncbi:MAG: phosphatidylinositol-specific phospholipase C domain-containing protein [Vibrionaceae bacterium]
MAHLKQQLPRFPEWLLGKNSSSYENKQGKWPCAEAEEKIPKTQLQESYTFVTPPQAGLISTVTDSSLPIELVEEKKVQDAQRAPHRLGIVEDIHLIAPPSNDEAPASNGAFFFGGADAAPVRKRSASETQDVTKYTTAYSSFAASNEANAVQSHTTNAVQSSAEDTTSKQLTNIVAPSTSAGKNSASATAENTTVQQLTNIAAPSTSERTSRAPPTSTAQLTYATLFLNEAASPKTEYEEALSWCGNNTDNKIVCAQKMLHLANLSEKSSSSNNSADLAQSYFDREFANHTASLLSEAQKAFNEWQTVVKELEQLQKNSTLSQTVVEPLTTNNHTVKSVLRFCKKNADKKAKCARKLIELPISANRTEAIEYLKNGTDSFIHFTRRRAGAWNMTVHYLQEQFAKQRPIMALTAVPTTDSKATTICKLKPQYLCEIMRLATVEKDLCFIERPTDGSIRKYAYNKDALKGTMEEGYAVAYLHDTHPGYFNPDWMAGIPNDARLSNISIPGTHNSLSRHGGDVVQTQSLDIKNQLDMGIRYFDARFKYRNGELYAYHGIISQFTTFDEFLHDISRFLDKKPSETVLIRMQNEDGAEEHTMEFHNKFREVVNKYCYNNVIPETDNPPLSELRGKFLFIDDFSKYGSRIGLDRIDFNIQDSYKLNSNWDLAEKWKKIKAHFAKLANNEANKISLNYLSGSVGSFPYFVASGKSSPHGPSLWTGVSTTDKKIYEDFVHKHCLGQLCSIHFKGINALTLAEIEKNPHNNFGVVVMDFPGAALVDAIIQSNKRHHNE